MRRMQLYGALVWEAALQVVQAHSQNVWFG